MLRFVLNLEGMGYSVQMDGAKIPIENFELECLPSEEGNLACNDLEFIEPIQEIEQQKTGRGIQRR